MQELALIGIGAGNPDHLTLQGVAALKAAELVLAPRKGAEKTALVDLRRLICARVLGADDPRLTEFDMPERPGEEAGEYVSGVTAWHEAVAAAWAAAVAKAGPDIRRVALLVWGDPALYDSALRSAVHLAPRPRITVIPGITALQALCAAHCIPLNTVGAPVLVTTGRRLRDQGWPDGVDSLAVMLDGGCGFERIDPEGVTIWWGAYLGMREELLRAGPLADIGPIIRAARDQARARHGWIMDIYLMRRMADRAQDEEDKPIPHETP